MTPPVPRYQEGLQAGIVARSRYTNGGPSLPWAISAPVVPFTFEELAKQELPPLDAFPRLLDHAERNLPPDPADAFRFRWFGLSYLAPARDGFRLRVRVPGGRLQASQLRGLAELAQEMASGYALVNEFAGVDLQTVSIRDAPEAVRRVDALGLNTRGADGDCLRALVNNLHPTPESSAVEECIDQLELLATHDRAFADLPRGCVIRFCPFDAPCDADGGNTLVLEAATLPATSFRAGWNGGRSDFGVLLAMEQVAPFCVELLRLWAQRADRTTRSAATLANFCAHQEPDALLGALERSLPFTLTRIASNNADDSQSITNVTFETEDPVRCSAAGRLLSMEMLALADRATNETAGLVRLVTSNFPVTKLRV